jgi:hypothetical protein
LLRGSLELLVDLTRPQEDRAFQDEEVEDHPHSPEEVLRVQHRLLGLDGDVDVRGDQIGQDPWMGDRLVELGRLTWQLGHHLDEFEGDLPQLDTQRHGLDRIDPVRIHDVLDPCPQVGRLRHEPQDTEAGEPLDKDAVVVPADGDVEVVASPERPRV